jgi:parallel beta-helix repeat protein
MDAANRVGGIHLKSAGGNPYPGSVNRIYNVHIQGGSLWIESRDNHIENCYVWAWTVDKGVFLGGASNYMSLVEVIPSPVAHGFYFNSSAVNCSMVNCIVDGSTDTILGGTGIYGDRSHRTRIIGCTIYNCSKRAISFRDALDCMVIGCNFYNNNRISDPSQAIYDGTQGYDDVVIESSLFPASGNIITNNTFRLTNDRTIKGYAIRESNAGSSPGANIISNNHFTASNYLTPYIKRESSETSLLNNKGPSLVSTVKYGTATITVASGLSYVIVNHGMPYTDIKESDIFVHATSNLGGASYFTHDITSSNNFAIRLDSLPAQDVSFSWAIRIA